MLKFILDLTRIVFLRSAIVVLVAILFLVSAAEEKLEAEKDKQSEKLQRQIISLEGKDGKSGAIARENNKIKGYKAKIEKNDEKIKPIRKKLNIKTDGKLDFRDIKLENLSKSRLKLLTDLVKYEIVNIEYLRLIADSNIRLTKFSAQLAQAKLKLSIVSQMVVYDYFMEQEKPFDLLERHHWLTLILLALGLFFGPVGLKALNFYVFAPLARKTKPIIINENQAARDGMVRYDAPEKELTLTFENQQSLLVKPGWYTLNTDGKTRTRLFWDLSKPFACYAMGLVNMTEFLTDDNQSREIKLAMENDPNHDLIAVHLEEHPGYVVRHSHVVATSGNDLAMQKKWQLWDWKNWLYGNIRYIYFTGTGTIYIHGNGRISTNNTIANGRIKERHVIGFDTTTPFKVIRTETFFNYWLNGKPLYDVHFPEQGHFVQQQSFGQKDDKIFRSIIEDIFGAIGKFFGF
jgi:hypothetical protein